MDTTKWNRKMLMGPIRVADEEIFITLLIFSNVFLFQLFLKRELYPSPRNAENTPNQI
jgi:hypothetical protein